MDIPKIDLIAIDDTLTTTATIEISDLVCEHDNGSALQFSRNMLRMLHRVRPMIADLSWDTLENRLRSDLTWRMVADRRADEKAYRVETLQAIDAAGALGWFVMIDGDTIVISLEWNSDAPIGAVSVFTQWLVIYCASMGHTRRSQNDAISWTDRSVLYASNGEHSPNGMRKGWKMNRQSFAIGRKYYNKKTGKTTTLESQFSRIMRADKIGTIDRDTLAMLRDLRNYLAPIVREQSLARS